TGFEVLQKVIETDEGSRYLGEVALVPHRSPISQSNLIFYNTLFDENASNHLAIGNAYPVCLEDGANLSREELEQRGLNTSLMHVDFMIGAAEIGRSEMLPAAWPTPGREQAQKKATRLRLSPLRFSACAEPKRERRPRV
ncbi:aminopeptidase, partial [Anoxybacillus sp. LAT_38]|nr:aminopeptidase [Anoxybacillus sp. LAT_38]